MAIFGIGARYENDDVSQDFKDGGFVGTGWSIDDAPDLHEFFKTLKTDDIVYLKSGTYSTDITVKGIGLISDEHILYRTSKKEPYQIARNVHWLSKKTFIMTKPEDQKNNVRGNTIYQEFHPDFVAEILNRIKSII